MGEIEKLLLGSETVAKDVMGYVQQHPQYAQLVAQLAEKLVQTALAGA